MKSRGDLRLIQGMCRLTNGRLRYLLLNDGVGGGLIGLKVNNVNLT